MTIFGRTQVDHGSVVKTIQDQLVKLGHLSEADRHGGEGRFGPRTEASVRAFQHAIGSSPSGIADQATQDALAAITSGKRVRRDATYPAIVRAMQDRLVELGLMERGRIGGSAGRFGPYTEESLKKFQQGRHIDQTGVLGEQTYKALFSEQRVAKAPARSGHHRFVLPIANMRHPLADGMHPYGLNRNLHGYSWGHPGFLKSHNVFHGFKHPRLGGDALDIYARVGTPVMAIADGQVVKYRCRGTKIEHIFLQGDGWVATYAHIHARGGTGTRYKQGEVVGILRPLPQGAHLHFELWLGGNAVHAATSRELQRKMIEKLDE